MAVLALSQPKESPVTAIREAIGTLPEVGKVFKRHANAKAFHCQHNMTIQDNLAHTLSLTFKSDKTT